MFAFKFFSFLLSYVVQSEQYFILLPKLRQKERVLNQQPTGYKTNLYLQGIITIVNMIHLIINLLDSFKYMLNMGDMPLLTQFCQVLWWFGPRCWMKEGLRKTTIIY